MTYDYIHRGSVGRRHECASVRTSLSAALRSHYDAGEIKGFWLGFIENVDDAFENLIPPDVEEITGGEFPYLYLRLNFRDEHPKNSAIQTEVADAGFESIDGPNEV
jgi:hypothetical protein